MLAEPRRGPSGLTVPGVGAPVPEVVLAASRRVEMTAGEIVFVQGDPGDAAYLVVAGRLKISQTARPDACKVLAVLGPGDVFGELSLFDPGPRSATAQALTDLTLRSLHRDVLGELVASDSDVAAWFIRHLAHRLRRATDAASQMVFANVPARTAAVLLDLADQFGDEDQGGSVVVDHGLTQTEIAQLAGATRETVNKALSNFVARGWIEVSRGSTRINDPAALARRAGRGPAIPVGARHVSALGRGLGPSPQG